MTDQRKKIIAISTDAYKGVSLIKTTTGTIKFYLGTVQYEAQDIDTAHKAIDLWHGLKVN